MHVNVFNIMKKKLAQFIELNALRLTLYRPIICYLNTLWRACGGIPLNGNIINNLCYADDTGLFSPSLSG